MKELPSATVGPMPIKAEVTVTFPNGQRFSTGDTTVASFTYVVLGETEYLQMGKLPIRESQWGDWEVVVKGFGKPPIYDAGDTTGGVK